MNIKAPLGTNLEITERKIARVESLVRKEVPPEELEIMVSNVGVVPDFSAIYTSNSGPHNGFVQVALKETHKISSFEYMARMRRRLQEEMPELTVYFQSGGFVDAVLNFGMPAPIDVQVSGPDLKTIFKVATTLAPKVRDYPASATSTFRRISTSRLSASKWTAAAPASLASRNVRLRATSSPPSRQTR
jgi:multidrug efflux pump subunit AcrB